MKTIILLAISYLIGSLSTGILISKYLKLPDPRDTGSGSAGATNVLRSLGRNKAAWVLAGDIVKGFVAVMLARIFGVHAVGLGLVAVAAVVGHIFPLYFKFKGGKGVATTIGTLFALFFFVGVLAAATWILVAFIFRYSSLASIIAIGLSPVYMFIFGNKAYAFWVLLITALVIWKHMDNINRLRAGTEEKIKL